MPETGHPPINRPQYQETTLVCLERGGFLDAPNFESARRLLSFHEDDDALGEVVRVRGLGAGFEFRERKKLETFLHGVGVLISLNLPVGTAVNTASILINQRSNGDVHARPDEAITDNGAIDNTEDDHADDGCDRNTSWPVYTSADVNSFQAIVFAPSPSPFVDDHEALLGENVRSVSLEADVRDGGPCSGMVMVRATFGHLGFEYSRGTGIVIDDRHIMTVAHNVWDRRYGPAKAITIYRDARADPDGTDYYHVEVAGVHCGWFNSKANDFALLRIVDRFSDKITPMRYQQTRVDGCPITATIYGFAPDLVESGSELHPQLVQSQGNAVYSVEEKVVCHNGDTVKGSSGGPVVNEDGVVIAIHRGWGKYPSVAGIINQAVAINRHDNDVRGFILALGAHQSTVDLSGVVRGQTIIFQTSRITPFAWNRQTEF
ncbi:hypothetical protein O1611_g7279 [Lasiodiplodia mahajangana]|uniref:Uncharacterized protein n=1 Tax=Lasiodiplodia mahajangana TaxID=1108764 RepID=A0ACC2JGA3_9PEZI|nr:hypothetical protein O1611_g7279 [Lasiodiplodia mahajangana]